MTRLQELLVKHLFRAKILPVVPVFRAEELLVVLHNHSVWPAS